MTESIDVLYSRVLAEVSDRNTSSERCVELLWKLYEAVPATKDGCNIYNFVVNWAVVMRPDYKDIIDVKPVRQRKSLSNVTRRVQRSSRRTTRRS